MPADRVQKRRSAGDVPDLGNPDRKRVLNVLAQRRYRQRRKEKIASLEAQAKDLQSLADHRSTSSEDASPPTGPTLDKPDQIEELTVMPYEDAVPDFGIQGDLFDTNLVEYLNPSLNLPTPLPSTPEFLDLQYSSSSSEFTFPLTGDADLLAMPVMNMLQALLSIATALNVSDKIWDPSYTHVMPVSASYPAFLPPNLHPTSVQFTIPHHPTLDLLPWPSMREKLILMLAMPNKLRPPIAQEDDDPGSDTAEKWSWSSCKHGATPAGQCKAIVQLVQDIDDLEDGGGFIIHGNSVALGQGNEYVEEAWEVGESFYRKWWFCLDKKIVDQSNKRRLERGLRRLRLTA